MAKLNLKSKVTEGQMEVPHGIPLKSFPIYVP